MYSLIDQLYPNVIRIVPLRTLAKTLRPHLYLFIPMGSVPPYVRSVSPEPVQHTRLLEGYIGSVLGGTEGRP